MRQTYTDEFIATLRRRYEETDEPVISIAADFRITEGTIYKIARRQGWKMRSRILDVPMHIRLHEEATALVRAPAARAESVDPRPGTTKHLAEPTIVTGEQTHQSAGTDVLHEQAPHPPSLREGTVSPQAGSGDETAASDAGRAISADADVSAAPDAVADVPAEPTRDLLKRVARQVIADMEAQLAATGAKPRPAIETERTARTLASLRQTLDALEQQENPSSDHDYDPDDDMPEDLDEFRRALARRIDAWVESRTDRGDGDGSGEPEVVDETP